MSSSKSSLPKLQDIQRRALKFGLDNNVINYHALLNNVDVLCFKMVWIPYLAIEVYKSVNINPDYLNPLFVEKDCPCN